MLPHLDKALSLYSELPGFDEEDLEDTVTDIRAVIDKLPQQHSALWDVFKTIRNKKDLEAYELLLVDEALRVDLYDRFAAFARLQVGAEHCNGQAHQLTTDAFVEGVRHATRHGKFQVTTDGFAPYKSAITTTLHDRCDYAVLIKVYAAPQGGEARYSPAEVSSTEVVPVMGQPDPDRICTSIVERQNLSVRMGTRRFTRLTNAFSKKWENNWAAVALWFTFYNFCRIHKTLRVTPAMEAGIANHVWREAASCGCIEDRTLLNPKACN